MRFSASAKSKRERMRVEVRISATAILFSFFNTFDSIAGQALGKRARKKPLREGRKLRWSSAGAAKQEWLAGARCYEQRNEDSV